MNIPMSQVGDVKGLSNYLCKALIDRAQNPYPHVPNPEGCKKRASVALVLRIRPNYNDWSSSSDSVSLDANQPVADQLAAFFAHEWVQNGDPEVGFIKRAARVGDRWTSHVALPGGRRDPEDEDDKAAAVRETSEEIGLDISSSDALYVGNLPERVVTTSFGRVPYVFLFLGACTKLTAQDYGSLPLYFSAHQATRTPVKTTAYGGCLHALGSASSPLITFGSNVRIRRYDGAICATRGVYTKIFDPFYFGGNALLGREANSV